MCRKLLQAPAVLCPCFSFSAAHLHPALPLIHRPPFSSSNSFCDRYAVMGDRQTDGREVLYKQIR